MVKIGIVGTGRIAEVHADKVYRVRGCRITACCDIDLTKARSFAKRYSIDEVFDSFEDMLERGDIDAVVNATPDKFHAELNRQCLKASKHVLSERPLALSYDEAKQLATDAKSRNVVNMVNYSHRSFACVEKAAEIIESGELGRVIHVEAHFYQSWLSSLYMGDWQEEESLLWRMTEEFGLGVLGELGGPLFDLVTYFAGDIKSVDCMTKCFHKGVHGNKYKGYRLTAPDLAVISAEFKNGAIGTLQLSRWATGYKNDLNISVYGDEGALKFVSGEENSYLEICSGEDRHKSVWKKVKCGSGRNLWQDFVQAVKNGEPVSPDFQRGAKIQKLIDLCKESSEEKEVDNV